MVKSILVLLRCVTFVTPNPSPPISWCKWQILVRQGHRLLPCKPLSFKNVGFLGTVPWTILKILESEKGINGESLSSFFRLQSFEGLSVRSEWFMFFGLVAQGHWVDHTSQQGQGDPPKAAKLGELGWWARCWLVHEWKARWFTLPCCFFSGEPGGPRFCRSALMVIFSSFPG